MTKANEQKDGEDVRGTLVSEKLVHFSCGNCKKWWTIGDAPKDKVWHCPWCGTLQAFKNISKRK